MPLTREFKDVVKARADCDPEFRTALLQQAAELFVRDDTIDGKAASEPMSTPPSAFRNWERRSASGRNV